MSNRVTRTAFLCCLFLDLPFSFRHASAQQTQSPESTAPTFQLNVNHVLVPVVVRDKQGRAISDLKKEDFQVFDEGKLRPIAGFGINLHGVAAQTTADGASPATTSHVPESSPATSRYVVFLFDDLHMNPEEVAHVQKAGAKVLESTLAPSDIAAVLSLSGKTNSGLTRDHAKLQQSLMSLQSNMMFRADPRACPLIGYFQAVQIENEHSDQGPAFKDAFGQVMNCNPSLDPVHQETVIENEVSMAANRALNLGRQDINITYANLTAFVRTMATLPGERTLILISPGFLPIEPESIYAESKLIDFAAQSNVTYSALDARGLYTAEINASEHTPGSNLSSLQQQSNYLRTSMTLAEDAMASLADGTGGTFFHNNNDLEAGFKQLASTPQCVYLLELSLDQVKPDGKYHRLKVKVDRDGAELQARRGYFMPKPEKHK